MVNVELLSWGDINLYYNQPWFTLSFGLDNRYHNVEVCIECPIKTPRGIVQGTLFCRQFTLPARFGWVDKTITPTSSQHTYIKRILCSQYGNMVKLPLTIVVHIDYHIVKKWTITPQIYGICVGLPKKKEEKKKEEKRHIVFKVNNVKLYPVYNNYAIKVTATSNYSWPLLIYNGETITVIGIVKGTKTITWNIGKNNKLCIFPKNPADHIIPNNVGAAKYYRYVSKYYPESWMSKKEWVFLG